MLTPLPHCLDRYLTINISLPATMASLCFHIMNTKKGNYQVRALSEHRARFCLSVLKDMQARWPIIASVYPFFTSLFRQYSGKSVSDLEEPPNTIDSHKEDVSVGGADGLHGCLSPEEAPSMAASGFAFGNIFDMFLNLPPDEN